MPYTNTISRNLLLACVLLPHPATAQMEMVLCTEPRPPFCLDDVHIDADALRRCAPQVDGFKRDMNRYLACVDDARLAAVKRGNKTIERWNELVRHHR